jgi:hypothetical protein
MSIPQCRGDNERDDHRWNRNGDSKPQWLAEIDGFAKRRYALGNPESVVTLTVIEKTSPPVSGILPLRFIDSFLSRTDLVRIDAAGCSA